MTRGSITLLLICLSGESDHPLCITLVLSAAGEAGMQRDEHEGKCVGNEI